MSRQVNGTKPSPSRFFGYPRAVEAPAIPYHKEEDTNPVFRGLVLVIGAWIVTRLRFLQAIIYANAGFAGIRQLQILKDYGVRHGERWDPTVIPITPCDCGSEFKIDPKSFPILSDKIPGRYHSIAEYHSMYLSGELTPLAVAESLLPLIRRDISPSSDHALAFISSHTEAILTAAKASTLRYQSGTPLGIMDGVPTAIKDELDIAGYATTWGMKRDNVEIAKTSSWPVQTLERAGAIILGKLNMHELGFDTTNNNPKWGTPRNPHNSQYYTGGSSGGSACVVSAGLVPMAVGRDGGGSIRIPSSFCGVYGLKTSHNRLYDGHSPTTVVGPIAATMSDLEIAFRIMAKSDPSDPVCSLFAQPCCRPSADRPKVIGIYKEWFNRADPSVLKICTEVVTYYKEILGYEVVDITLPYIPEAELAHSVTILSELTVSRREKTKEPRTWLTGLTPANQVLLSLGTHVTAEEYAMAQQLRNMLMQHLAFLYQKYPGLVIVTPTTPMAGWPIENEGDLTHGISDGNKSMRNMEYVFLANFCGNPAISCPVGYAEPQKGEGNVPVGIMAMGEWGTDLELIEWGRECEVWLNEVSLEGRQRPSRWEDMIVNAKGKMVS